ncbi:MULTISPECIES: 7-carboxy-7-deazaguanine synthase [unclassified Sphingopyxis]|jgi:7-carboxy-7-deazaguanine synthase (Cx14CxxC type)|uniref:7-carboxy-7-deazaguanine synthase n=1 Tax=unclassified Sphingopyxis TaxID=2614943 RepID=UPI0006C1F7B8|nr:MULTISPECIES: 7-carboxy-7-deazaguanine synthase [unclassified Sphingopyxis]USI79119.1 7-carboxy-7-deazaguanine synthase [Sphingopyxis sp. USTB-05]GAO78446.1 queuosine biosynthesisQueE radical SAM [Sphingopyxis sp. C-1]
MTYAVKEIFLTLQGEGAQAGRRAVFCRFAGCNLWTGREKDRAKAICQFCDTDFVGTDGSLGGKYKSAAALADVIAETWGKGGDDRYVVLTGGEPMLQVDAALIDALHERDFTIAIESNGTFAIPRSIDWICVSPKAGSELVQTSGDELKLVWPQPGSDVAWLAALDFEHLLVQPLDDPHAAANVQACIDLVMDDPRWRLSLQTHKNLGLR